MTSHDVIPQNGSSSFGNESCGWGLFSLATVTFRGPEDSCPKGCGGLMALRDWYCEDILSGKLDVQRVHEDDRVLASVVDGPSDSSDHDFAQPPRW